MRSGNLFPQKRLFLGTASLLLVMMAAGSVWDYSISQAAYNPDSPFGLFFAAFGELLRPAPCCCPHGTGKSI